MQETRETGVRPLGQEDSSGGGNGKSIQYSLLENRMNKGAWWATVHGAAKSWTRLSDFTFIDNFISHHSFSLFSRQIDLITVP